MLSLELIEFPQRSGRNVSHTYLFIILRLRAIHFYIVLVNE